MEISRVVSIVLGAVLLVVIVAIVIWIVIRRKYEYSATLKPFESRENVSPELHHKWDALISKNNVI
jgi:hypothetical protein